MNSIPTIANGGLLAYMAVALLLVWLAAVSRPSRRVVAVDGTHHKNNPVSVGILPDEDAAGATTNPFHTKEAAMTDSTVNPISTDRLLEAAADLRPWWAAKGPRVMHYGADAELDDCGWIRWYSTLIGDEDYGVRLQRTITIDDQGSPLGITDEISLAIEDQQLAFPIDHADDVIALIRAATAIADTPDDDGWVGPDGRTWPSKSAYYESEPK